MLGLLLVGKDDSVRLHSAVEHQPSVCCLTSSRQLDAFLGAYKHFSEMYAFEYGDILVLCVLCEGKKYKSRI